MSDFCPLFTITNAITRYLTTIERARGFLQAATLSDKWVTSMSQRAMLLEAHHTTHIEGTQLTLEQSEQLLAGKAVEGVSEDDRRELLNYRDAFDLVAGILLPRTGNSDAGNRRPRNQSHSGRCLGDRTQAQ